MCPPESASAVMSSATGISRANLYSSSVISLAFRSSFKIFSGAGEKNFFATSILEAFAIILFFLTISPLSFLFKPFTAYLISAGVNSIYAEASAIFIPFLTSIQQYFFLQNN